MTFEPDRVRTVTFDSYSTLVDVDAVETALAAHSAIDEPEPISRNWRNRAMQYTLVGNHTETYKPFYEVNRDVLEYAPTAHEISGSSFV